MPPRLKPERIERLRTLGLLEGGAPAPAEPAADPITTALATANQNMGAIATALQTIAAHELAEDIRKPPLRWRFTVTKRDAAGRILEMDATAPDEGDIE